MQKIDSFFYKKYLKKVYSHNFINKLYFAYTQAICLANDESFEVNQVKIKSNHK